MGNGGVWGGKGRNRYEMGDMGGNGVYWGGGHMHKLANSHTDAHMRACIHTAKTPKSCRVTYKRIQDTCIHKCAHTHQATTQKLQINTHVRTEEEEALATHLC